MYHSGMRTTIDFDPDTAKAIERLRNDGRGLSEAVNELIRRGMIVTPQRQRFEPRTKALGLRIDVSNIADALDVLEGSDAR